VDSDWQILPPPEVAAEDLTELIPLEEVDPPLAPAQPAADEPLGLLPADHWSRPAQPESTGGPVPQDADDPWLQARPLFSKRQEPPAKEPEPPPIIARPVAEVADPYDVHQPDLWMPPPPHPLAEPEAALPEPEIQLPPARPLWQGVYTFPWHVDTLRVWFLLGLVLSLLAGLGAGDYYLLTNQGDQQWVEYRLLFMMTVVFTAVYVLILAWMSGYVGAYFLDAVQETAGGRETICWPENSFFERLVKLAHLLFVVFCTLLPLAFLAWPLKDLLREGYVGLILLLLPVPFFFPLFLLSSLANQSPWFMLHGKVVLYVVRRPGTVGLVVLMSVVLLSLCSLMGYWTVVKVNYLSAPLTGFFWAACVLIYGRLLGRVAWLIAREDAPAESGETKRKKKKKSKKPAPAESPGGAPESYA
jgi:hypothetical protein